MGDGLVVIVLPSLQLEMASGTYNAPFLVKCKSTKNLNLGGRWVAVATGGRRETNQTYDAQHPQ